MSKPTPADHRAKIEALVSRLEKRVDKNTKLHRVEVHVSLGDMRVLLTLVRLLLGMAARMDP